MVRGEWVESWWSVLVSCYNLATQQWALELVYEQQCTITTHMYFFYCHWIAPSEKSTFSLYLVAVIMTLVQISTGNLCQSVIVSRNRRNHASYMGIFIASSNENVVANVAATCLALSVFGRCLCGRCLTIVNLPTIYFYLFIYLAASYLC